MKRLWIIVVLVVVQASPSLRAAATSRGFTSTQAYTPGGSPGSLWFSQPLQTESAKKTSAKKIADKDVESVPPPPSPKSKSVKDTRNIYNTTKTDKKKVVVKSERDDNAADVKPKRAKSFFQPTSYDQLGKVPNSGVKTKSNEPGIFTFAPPPKPRHHGFGDWP
jgi:hypothetical protein